MAFQQCRSHTATISRCPASHLESHVRRHAGRRGWGRSCTPCLGAGSSSRWRGIFISLSLRGRARAAERIDIIFWLHKPWRIPCRDLDSRASASSAASPGNDTVGSGAGRSSIVQQLWLHLTISRRCCPPAHRWERCQEEEDGREEARLCREGGQRLAGHLVDLVEEGCCRGCCSCSCFDAPSTADSSASSETLRGRRCRAAHPGGGGGGGGARGSRNGESRSGAPGRV